MKTLGRANLCVLIFFDRTTAPPPFNRGSENQTPEYLISLNSGTVGIQLTALQLLESSS